MFTEFMRKMALLNSKMLLKTRKISGDQLPSLIYPQLSSENKFLTSLVADAGKRACDIEIKDYNPTLPDGKYVNRHPGEHYRFLNSVIKCLNLKNVVEIGTWTGMGSRSILDGNQDVVLNSFDIISWDQIDAPSHLDHEFVYHNSQFNQIIADLSCPSTFAKHFDLLDGADLIFLDGPKNGSFEYKFIDLLRKLSKKDLRILVIDDIRFLNMADLWLDISSPKLDATSFAHWSGTGVVDLSDGLHLYSQSNP